MKLKVCGATDRTTCAMLDALGVAWVGLWFRMPRARHNLDETKLQRALAGFSRHPAGAQPVLVTLTADPEWLSPLFDRHGLSHLQLHGFQLPETIARLKRACPDIRLFKTLHVQQGRCLEERLIGAYLGAGVDAFVVDSFTSRDVAGSTGQRYDPTLLARLSARYPTAQWLCAGGLAAEHLPELAQQLPCLAGVDIDSGARVDGRIDATRVRRLLRNLETSATRMALQ